MQALCSPARAITYQHRSGLNECPRSGLVDDERLAPGKVAYVAWDADMRPGVKFTDDLIEWKLRQQDGTDYGVWRHAWHSNICCAAFAVLAAVLASHGVVYRLRSEGAIHHDGLAAQRSFYDLQKLGQTQQVGSLYFVGHIVQRSVIGMRQLGKGEVRRHFLLLMSASFSTVRPPKYAKKMI